MHWRLVYKDEASLKRVEHATTSLVRTCDGAPARVTEVNDIKKDTNMKITVTMAINVNRKFKFSSVCILAITL